ncbi:MAG: hypothetical protein M1401_17485 [Chloroflexi bacterium]|nr:hypothetical protein [Chloroflexota bacterium]
MPVNEIGQSSAERAVRREDYTLHGLVTIRLVDAPAEARAELAWLLGPSQGQPAAEPDVTIRYVPRLPRREGLQYVGLHEAAFDEEEFYLVGPQGQLATFPFARLGGPSEFLCEPGVSILSYLLPVLGLRLLAKGYVMLHAASLVHEGKGVLVTGWQKGGKTETLLAFMRAGAQYLGDEWTILSPAEGKMWGIAGTLQIWDWHLRQQPDLWRRLRPAERNRLRLLRAYQHLYGLLPSAWRGRGAGGEWLRRLSLDGGNALWGQARSAPARLFGENLWRGPAPVDVVFLAGIGPKVQVVPLEAVEVARRMIASLAFERRSLTALYQEFRYAFPERHNDLLDTASDHEERLLRQSLCGTLAHQVLHPYPVSLSLLYQSCLPLVRQVEAEPQEQPILETEEPLL